MNARIKLAMDIGKYSQTYIANQLGVSPQSVQQWVTGKAAPKGKRLIQLSAILGVSVDWLSTAPQNPAVVGRGYKALVWSFLLLNILF